MTDTIKIIILTAVITVSISHILELLFKSIFPKIWKQIKLAIKQHNINIKMEKNAVFMSPFPIFKSPNGYIYEISGGKKNLFCGECYSSPSKLIRLKRIGGRFSKKYICPSCNTEYKAY
jgi:hypothetical protein